MATFGNDVLQGSLGPDAIDALDGADQVYGGDGADQLSGGGGADFVSGGDGDDVLYGFGVADLDPASGLIGATRLAAGLAKPLFAASPPGRPDELFVVEQHTGRIVILDTITGAVRPQAFLDIPANELSTGGEQGLLGLAFHPDYAANGRFYVNLTNAAGDTEIWEYTRSANPDVAEVASKRLILGFDQPFENHNGGWMGFGPDGLLYIASGDGGSGGDPQNNAQNIDSLLGKILRVDVDGDAFPTDPARNYAIPAGNPFAAGAGADEVWATGLRNPWRMSFDRATGDLWVGDVGQNAREEVTVLAAGTGAGANLGWRFKEGFTTYDGAPPPDLTDPLLDYAHGSGPMQGRSVTGGYVNRGPGGAQGLYVFGDFVTGNLWTVRAVGGQPVDFINRKAQLAVDAGTVNLIASFAEDGRGRLYVIGLDGEIHRLSFSEAAADGADVLTGDAGADRIYGGGGDDELHGGDGGDQLYGGIGADRLIGGAGGDFLDGGAGADEIDGGAGFDAVGYASAMRGVIVDLLAQRTWDGAVNDTLASIENALGSSFGDTFYSTGGANAFDGGAGADTVTYAGSTRGVIVDLFAGASFDGVAGDVLLSIENAIGSDFGDLFYSSAGPNALNGGAGSDSVTYAGSAGGVIVDLTAQASFDGSSRDQFVSIENATGSALNDTMWGDAGPNVLDGGAGGADSIFGEGGLDTVSYAASTRGVIVDLAAQLTWDGLVNDRLQSIENAAGSAFADQLYGDGGANRLSGGAGADLLVGGGGNDVFVFRSGFGQDRIADFQFGPGPGDAVDVAGLFADFAALLAAAAQDGADVLIAADAATTLRLHDVALGQLTADDFLFAPAGGGSSSWLIE